MFSWYKYLIVSLVFSHLGFWSGSLFLIAHFPDLCLLVLFFEMDVKVDQIIITSGNSTLTEYLLLTDVCHYTLRKNNNNASKYYDTQYGCTCSMTLYISLY